MKKPENEIRDHICKTAQYEGWKIHKLNVSAGRYSTVGFPDVYMTIPVRRLFILLNRIYPNYITLPDYERGLVLQNHRWVEFKTPNGRLEQSQIDRFTEFAACDIGVWIISGWDQYEKIYHPPNWHHYLLTLRTR